MKRVLSLVSIIIFILTVLPSGCSKRGINKITIVPFDSAKQSFDLTWSEPNIKFSVKPYSVKQDLAGVTNLLEFQQLDVLDKYLLSRNLFIIKKTEENFEQSFNIYEKNAVDGIPSFITSDSILHIYHLMYDYVIRNVERERLITELKAFTEGAFKQSMLIYNGIVEPNAKKAALKNIAYFGIAMRLLEIDLPGGIPLEANRIIDNDVKRIKIRWSSGTSEIFPYLIDYKNYIARGHYLRESDFTNYFLTMMWYGNTPFMFDIYDSKISDYKRMDEQILMTVIMASGILGDVTLKNLWDDIYKVTTMFYGRGEDASLYDLSDIIKVMYGTKIDFNKLWDEERIQKVYELTRQRYNLHSGETISGRINLSNTNGKLMTQFRLMGQMYNIDSDVYNNIFADNDLLMSQSTSIPKGLEIPAAFGSEDALTVLKDEKNEDMLSVGYSENMQRLRGVLSGISGDNPLDYSFNNFPFWALKALIKPYRTGYPTFMTGDSWGSKKLLTFSGAVSDIRHPTYLVTKQLEIKSEEIESKDSIGIPGYVEPEINLYSRLEYMGGLMKEFLSINKFNNKETKEAIDKFIDSAAFLKNISQKELENTQLNKEEEIRLQKYYIELESLSINMADSKSDSKQWEQIPSVDRNMATVSDAYIYGNKVFQSAIGSPDFIYVIVPYNNKLYLTRGSVYSYYEFVKPVNRKLDDKSWQNMIKEGKDLEQQMWIKKIRY